jgi:hypothetical protein
LAIVPPMVSNMSRCDNLSLVLLDHARSRTME